MSQRHPGFASDVMAPGLLHSALVEECRQSVLPPEGYVISLAGSAAAFFAAFALGARCGVACVSAADAAAAVQWWFGPAADPNAARVGQGRRGGDLRRRLG